MSKIIIDNEIIPDKLFFTIGEVSEITGIEPYVLRYWESEFKMLNPQKNLGGQRAYRRKDVETVLKIKHLLYDQKFTIAGAKKRLKETKQSNLQLELVDATNGSQKNDKTIEVIEKLRFQLKSLLEYLDKK